MRRKVLRALEPLDPHPVENSVCPGFPDVEHALGVVELKSISGWPIRATTAVAVPHFTVQQKVWHQSRARAGGATMVILRVDREWLAFGGEFAAEHLGNLTSLGLRANAYARWESPPTDRELLECVTRFSRTVLLANLCRPSTEEPPGPAPARDGAAPAA